VVVKIKKNYPGQGMKVINSLLGAGQMMFSKYLAVVSGEINIRDYRALVNHIIKNTDPVEDLLFSRGPLDVLDHSSDAFAFGGKLGIDATVKLSGEKRNDDIRTHEVNTDLRLLLNSMVLENMITAFDIPSSICQGSILIVSVNVKENPRITFQVAEKLKDKVHGNALKLVIIVDHTVDITDHFVVAWQVLGNSDPSRDHIFISGNCILIDGTIKLFREKGFKRSWPNVVCSDEATIKVIDEKWDNLGLGDLIESPSKKHRLLEREGKEEVVKGNIC